MPPQYERGLYEPSDEVRVFDGSEEDEDTEGSRLPLLIVLALLVLAMFAGFVWLAYTQGVARGRTQTPVLTAQAGPARVAPQNPGGAEQPFKGFKIYEQPAPPDDGVADAAAPVQAQPQAMTPAEPAPAQQVAKVEPAPAVTKPEPAKIEAAPKPAPAKVEAAPVEKPKPASKVAPAPAAKPVVAAKVTPPPAAPVQKAEPIGPASAAPRTLTALPPIENKAEVKPAPTIKELAAAPAPKPVAKPAPVAATGSAVLQIGAYKSQADADAAWKTYSARHAALLAGYGPDVARADLGEKGIWYRLRIAGFANKDVASALCDRLKADGGGCFLAQ